MIHLCLLGSTGSIGKQTLEVVKEHTDKIRVIAHTAQKNADLLIQQAIEFLPEFVVIVNEEYYSKVREALKPYPIEVWSGKQALNDVVALPQVSHVLTALVGFSGLEPTVNAIKNKKNIALANKETLVVAGQLINELLKQYQVKILPVDSEHSAIFQCLVGENPKEIHKIYLTASGGPFRTYSREQLQKVTPEQALKHPNWSMGNKITIDSATLMNKGLEVIEAKWLFHLKNEQIEVVVHPQSIVHPMVEFQDGSIKAQLGMPDMKLPIQYALSYPTRWTNTSYKKWDFATHAQLTFEKPNLELFPCLDLAFYSLKKGGNTSCVLNAANEIAVERFLKNQIPFLQIPKTIEKVLHKIHFVSQPSLKDLYESDAMARSLALEFC
jgi:1-deoxy-D-xylulose-5-phosphate reductoisomerase